MGFSATPDSAKHVRKTDEPGEAKEESNLAKSGHKQRPRVLARRAPFNGAIESREPMKRHKRISRSADSLQTSEGPIPFQLTRSSARRTMTICVDEQARVRVAAPAFVLEEEIHHFIRRKARWIQDKMNQARVRQNILSQRKYDHGEEFLFLGKKYRMDVEERILKAPRLAFDGSRWVVGVPSHLPKDERQDKIKEKVIQWYRRQAEEILGSRLFHYARLIGVEPKKVAVRTQKRLWGNCDYRTRTIHLNWQIVLAPVEVMDYVVVHELCHLIVPNHSRRFWQKVEKIMPDYKRLKQWLRDHAVDMAVA